MTSSSSANVPALYDVIGLPTTANIAPLQLAHGIVKTESVTQQQVIVNFEFCETERDLSRFCAYCGPTDDTRPGGKEV